MTTKRHTHSATQPPEVTCGHPEHQAPAQHTPGPLDASGEYGCGCIAYISHMQWCPLHATAPELYKLLARIYVEEGAALRSETCSSLLSLLAKIQETANG